MTKTEAAETLALRVRVTARATGATINKDLVEAILSEARNWGGIFPAAVAAAQIGRAHV